MPKFYAPGEYRNRNRTYNKTFIIVGKINNLPHTLITGSVDPIGAAREWGAYRREHMNVRFSKEMEYAIENKVKTFAEVTELYLYTKDYIDRNAQIARKLCAAPIPGHGTLGEIPITDVLPMHLDQAAFATCAGKTASSRNRLIYVPGSAILHFAHQNQMRADIRIKRAKEPKPRNRRPQPGDMEKLLANTTHVKHAFLTVLAYQGWRVTEALSLEHKDVNFEEMTLTIWINKVKTQKTVVMHPRVAEVIRGLAKTNNYRVFPWRDRFRVYDWLKPLCANLGLDFTPHMSRHEYASRLHETGFATARDIRDLGTWTSTIAVERYVNPTLPYQRSIVERLTMTSSPPDDRSDRSGDCGHS